MATKEELKSEFEAVDRSRNRVLFVVLAFLLPVSIWLQNASSAPKLVSNVVASFLFVTLVSVILWGIISTILKKRGIMIASGIRCDSCGYLPDIISVNRAIEDLKCQRCGESRHDSAEQAVPPKSDRAGG